MEPRDAALASAVAAAAALPHSMKPIHGIPTSVIVVVSVLVLLHAAALAWWLKKAVEKPQKGWGTLEGKKKT